MARSSKDLSAAVMPSRVKVKTARAVFAPGQRRLDGSLCWLFVLYRAFILYWVLILREKMVVEKGRKQMKKK